MLQAFFLNCHAITITQPLALATPFFGYFCNRFVRVQNWFPASPEHRSPPFASGKPWLTEGPGEAHDPALAVQFPHGNPTPELFYLVA